MELKNLFFNLFKNIANCFKKVNLAWQILFCLLTYLLVISGFDFWYFKISRATLIQELSFPAVFVGMFVPVFLPIIIYFYGKSHKNLFQVSLSYALLQSAFLGWLISSTYKLFTGRLGPHGFLTTTSNVASKLVDLTKDFQFGIYRGGIFQGWPSSHTTVAFAMSFVLISFFPNKKWIKYSALIYAFYIGFGVSTTIHWFSDFVAGAILGSIIGISVGRSFYQKIKNKNSQDF